MPTYLYGQCENTKRTYANFQGSYVDGFSVALGSLKGSITDPANAVNGNVKDASTLAVPISILNLTGTATQYLEFTDNGNHSTKRKLSAGTPVTLKLTLPSNLLGVLSGFEIGSFTDLAPVGANLPLIGAMNDAGYTATRLPLLNTSELIGAVNRGGEVELTVVPTAEFNGIYIRITGALVSAALSMKVFHAYIMESTTSDIDCDEAIDVLSGVKPIVNGLGALTATGTVSNPYNAIDASADSYALMSVGVEVLSSVHLTAIFNKPSQPGDFVAIKIQNASSILLDLELLKGFSVQPYLGDVAVGSPFTSSSTFLGLQLLPGPGDTKILTFPVSNVYDRLEIKMGGLANALGGLRIYDIKRTLATPRTLNTPATTEEQTICEGGTATFTVQAPQNCTEYMWYDAAVGGSLVGTGTSFTTSSSLLAGEYDFYVQGNRTYCQSSVSERVPVKLRIHPLPSINILGATICSGNTASLTVVSPSPNFTYNWYNSNTGGTPFHVGSNYLTSPLILSTTFYLEAINTLTGCKSSGGLVPVSITVKPYAPVQAVAGNSIMCSSTTQILTNSYPGGVWSSSDETVATVDVTGMVTAITSGNVVISYSVADDANYCGKVVNFNLTINPLPSITLGTNPGICEGISNIVIPYTNPLFNPSTYSISWTGGTLPPVADQALFPNEITISVPANTPPAVYPGLLTIKNANGCEKTIAFSIKVKQIPHKPVVSIE